MPAPVGGRAPRRRQRQPWRNAALPADVMAEVRKAIPSGAQNIRVMQSGSKFRVVFERNGKRYRVYPWDVSEAHYRMYPTGKIGGQPGAGIINAPKIIQKPVISPQISPVISPHIEVKPNIIVKGGKEKKHKKKKKPKKPEPPLIDFEALREEIQANVKWAEGQLGDLGAIKDPKFKPKLGFAFGDFLNSGGLKKPGWGSRQEKGWGILHPLRTLGRLFNFREAGGIAYRRNVRAVERARGLRAELKVEENMRTAHQTYREAMIAQLERLERSFNQGRIRHDNAGRYLGNYRGEMLKAKHAFRGSVTNIITGYRSEAVKRKIIGKDAFVG